MAQDNSVWNIVKQALQIPLMEDVGKSVTVKEEGGIGGYELTIRKEESIKLQTDITDYVSENNSSLQDNIAIKPITFSIEGIVAEKYLDAKIATTMSEEIANKLGPVLPYIPDITEFVLGTLVVTEALLKAGKKALEETQNFINGLMGIKSETTLNEQERAFMFFYSAYKARELMEVSLPWCSLNNCAITSVELIQPKETRSFSTIKLNFKQMNFASTITGVGVSVGRRKTQEQPPPQTNLSNTKSSGTSKSVSVGTRGQN